VIPFFLEETLVVLPTPRTTRHSVYHHYRFAQPVSPTRFIWSELSPGRSKQRPYTSKPSSVGILGLV
jgi:hypothetical protein